MLPILLLSAITFDAEAAYSHARYLAALGPHPWGSTRIIGAADYIESQFRDIGLEQVRPLRFEREGIIGTNVVGVLKGSNPQFVVVGAHHDTVPGSPGAYDDSAGVGVLIETARVFSKRAIRPRTLVFVSFDGEEAWAQTKTTTAGSRAYVAALDPQEGNFVAAVIIEMCGFPRGRPCLHPIAYPDPLRPGRTRIVPSWLVKSALEGARGAGAELHLGDRWLSWLYQPAVRFFRIPLYGDDLSFVQAGLPAILLSDSSLTSFYPWYHQSDDTPDKLDNQELDRMGRATLGIVSELLTTPRGPARDPVWYAVSEKLLGASALLSIVLVVLAPGLLVSVRRGGLTLGARALHAVVFLVLYWRHPVATLWLLALPSLVFPFARSTLAVVPALAPMACLLVIGAYGFRYGAITGLWWAPWEWPLLLTALALAWFMPSRRKTGGKRGRRRRGLPK